MLGLVPSIHAFFPSRGGKGVDPRDKPEDDGGVFGTAVKRPQTLCSAEGGTWRPWRYGLGLRSAAYPPPILGMMQTSLSAPSVAW
jgi:hypothetical protein